MTQHEPPSSPLLQNQFGSEFISLLQSTLGGPKYSDRDPTFVFLTHNHSGFEMKQFRCDCSLGSQF